MQNMHTEFESHLIAPEAVELVQPIKIFVCLFPMTLRKRARFKKETVLRNHFSPPILAGFFIATNE